MELLDEETRRQLSETLAPIEVEVELTVFTAGQLVIPGRDAPGLQEETVALLREVTELNDKLSLAVRPLTTDDEAASLGIVTAPTTLLRERGSDRSNIRFLGLPGGYEFATLVEALLILGTGESGLGDVSRERLAEVASPVRFRSFVTPTCPYCPRAVLTGYRYAFHNPNVIAMGVEANEFPTLAQKYRISSVPDTIIEGSITKRVLGGQPERVFIEALLEAAAVPSPAGAQVGGNRAR